MSITFIMHVYKEPFEMVEENVIALNKFYPESQVHLIYDGVPIQGHSGSIERVLDRVKIPGKFGLWTHRHMKIFLDETESDYLIRIDPDTNVLGKIENLPDPTKPTIFCRMIRDMIPHGGTIGYTRPMVELLVNKGWFIDEEFLKYHRYHMYQDYMLQQIIKVNRLHVQVRHDIGWEGRETTDTKFSHYGNFGPYIGDLYVPR